MNAAPGGRWAVGLFAIAQLVLTANAAEPAKPPLITLDIKRQPLGDALNELARQSGLQIVLYTQVGEGVSAPTLLGKYTAVSALEKLLNGTALDYQFINPRTVAIEPKSGKQPNTSSLSPSMPAEQRAFMLAQAEPRRPADTQPNSESMPSTASPSRDETETARSDLSVQQVTVTARRREESLQTTLR
jgi:iron complex outermembrane receptor protein